MNEILISYDDKGVATCVITGEGKENIESVVREYFHSSSSRILDDKEAIAGKKSIIINPEEEMTAEEAKEFYVSAEQGIKQKLTDAGVTCKITVENKAPKKTTTSQLLPRLDETGPKTNSMLSQKKLHNFEDKISTVVTEGLANEPEKLQEITTNIAKKFNELADKLPKQYTYVPAKNATDNLPRLQDITTHKDIIVPQKTPTGEMAFSIFNASKNPDAIKALKDSFPLEQRFTVSKCSSVTAAETLIEQMGGHEKLTFDDKNPIIAGFKEALKANYPDLKFTSEKPKIEDEITSEKPQPEPNDEITLVKPPPPPAPKI